MFHNPLNPGFFDFKVKCGVCGLTFRCRRDMMEHKLNHHSY